MDVKERIERICKRKNIKYSDFRNTIYYYSFLDLISRSEENISDEDIISNARIYSISLLERNKNIDSKDLELFKEILESKNEAVVELTMSVIAIVDNMEYFPHDALELLHKMAIQDENYYTRKDYERFYHAVVGKLESLSANYGEEKWGIPYEDELVENLSIRSNAYERYMQVLDEASEPYYTDFAIIVSPFVKTPSYAHDNNKIGVLCVLKGPEYAILDPHTNDVNYTIISGAEEAGIRPKYKYNSKKPPKNEGYVSTDSRITEFGYWPIHAVSVSEQMDLDVDHKKRLVGSITTGISFINGKPIRKLADCYEYKGEIYTLVPAEFINGMGGDQILSNNGSYRNGDCIWTKFEPLECYVDKGTKNIITSNIIMSGIDVGLLGIYFDNYFTKELHQFDVFYQCKRRNLEKKPIPFSNDRIRLINLINQMIDNPGMSVDDESFYVVKDKNNNVASSEIKKDNTSKLDEAIDAYIAFDKDNIDTSKIDDYVRAFKAIIEQLKFQDGINEETISSLQGLIQPLDDLTNPDRRIERILNGGGAGEKIASDEKARIMSKELIPMTDQIVRILCQKYRTDYYTHSSTGSKTVQLIDARNRFDSLISTAKNNDEIDELSYLLLDSLNRLISLSCDFIEENKLKKILLDISKPLEHILNVNNRIVSLIGFGDSVEFKNIENNDFIKKVLEIYSVLNPTLDVIYENYNIENEPVSQNTNSQSVLDVVTSFFSGLNPFAERGSEPAEVAEDIENDSVASKKEGTAQANSNLKIQEITIEEAISVLSLYSGKSKQNDLKELKKLLESRDYSFDIGSIGDLKFIVLKNQIDNRTFVCTDRPEMGNFEFSLEDNHLTYKNNYWQGDERHTLEVTQIEKIPPKKRVEYRVKNYANPDSVRKIHEDKYNESKRKFSIEDEEGILMSSYEAFNDKFRIWRQHGMSEVTIKAIQSDINELIPIEILKILELYSKNIAEHIHFSDKIFNDENGEIPY